MARAIRRRDECPQRATTSAVDAMTSTPKKALHELEKAPPGTRFERLYRKRRNRVTPRE